MKVLLDESVHERLRPLLTGHDVFTVGYLGWKGTKNGALVSKAIAEGFDVIVTTDRGIADQVNLSGKPIAIVIMYGATNRYRALAPMIPELLQALNHVQPGTLAHVRP